MRGLTIAIAYRVAGCLIGAAVSDVSVNAATNASTAVVQAGADKPRSASAGGTAPSAFNTCFNTALYAAGTQYRLAYTFTGQVEGSGDTEGFVSVNSSFNGVSGLVRVDHTSQVTLTRPRSTFYTVETQDYFGPVSQQGLKRYGALVPTMPGSPLVVQLYTPPWMDPTPILRRGQSASATYILDSEGKSPPQTMTVTFVEIENVEVPAGRFTACHFRLAARTDKRTVTTDMWYSTGTGVVVKLISPGEEKMLTSGTINGRSVQP